VKQVRGKTCCSICTKYSYIERFRRWFYSVIMGRRCRDRMVVECTTTFTIYSKHHWSCKFEYRPWRGVLDTTLCDKFVSKLRHVGCFHHFLPPINPNWLMSSYYHFCLSFSLSETLSIIFFSKLQSTDNCYPIEMTASYHIDNIHAVPDKTCFE
jgi:hypothetical protein